MEAVKSWGNLNSLTLGKQLNLLAGSSALNPVSFVKGFLVPDVEKSHSVIYISKSMIPATKPDPIGSIFCS